MRTELAELRRTYVNSVNQATEMELELKTLKSQIESQANRTENQGNKSNDNAQQLDLIKDISAKLDLLTEK